MTDECRFWLQWGVNALIATATLGAVLAALFGDWFRARWFPPRLALSMPMPEGVRTPVGLSWRDDQGVEHTDTRDGRYYHVEVRNTARGAEATQVQVCIVRLEEPRADGQFEITWTGELPLRWMHQQIHPVVRVVGRTAIADLCSVVRDKWVELHPMIGAMNFNARRRKEHPAAQRDFIVSLEALSAEGSSPPLRLRITWDGEWADGDTEMRRHLVINDVTSQQ